MIQVLLCKNVVDQLLGDDAMGPRGVHLRLLVQPRIDRVQPRRQVAAHVKPPIAHEHGLRELRAVRAQEAGLTAVDVAIVPA